MTLNPPCPRCGGRTYTWGEPLPGQWQPPEGAFDDRIRSNWTCVKCGATDAVIRRSEDSRCTTHNSDVYFPLNNGDTT